MTYLDEQDRNAIRPIKRRVEDEFLSRPGVIGVDIGEKITGGRPTGRAAIVVYVCAKGPNHPLQIPASVEGIPTDVVAESIVLHRALLSPDEQQPVVAERHAVLRGGISIGPARAVRVVPPDVSVPGDYVIVGTMGALVVSRGERQVLGLTNFHVGCVDDAWMVGDRMVHPSRVDGGVTDLDDIGVLNRAALSGSVNAAAVLLDPDRPHRAEILDIGAVTGSAAAAVGTTVRKRGRTTALTHGVVASTDATITVDFGDGIGIRRLRNQLRVTACDGRFGDHGDSGSVLVDADNRIVGLYCAGTLSGSMGFANPIDRVLDQLDVEVLTPDIPSTRTPAA
ncbi:hypothetical protein Lesp02_84640 [Lentzea sp. NBRC 105346]|uniref:hypothetical protein n=1 Tax=Lentzea sp. NBRC 105346 TaxID=3032205 RepID=UPI0024A34480|nr:hypothetical protein [Lentzea sp. NBRC 105346]GLZ36277.1 hypothetical protein Lesp02_84640 [Lentzea sp. NBRC 105346]